MSLRKNVLRQGDYVKITNPYQFLRCGYPWSKQHVKDNVITKEQKEAVWELMRKFDLGAPLKDIPLDWLLTNEAHPFTNDVAFNELIEVLSYHVLKANSFGGKERTIHTKHRPDLDGLYGHVMYGRKVVKTGTYCAPCSYKGWTDYGYEYDYDPGGLADEETHVIHLISVYYPDNILRSIDDVDLWFEKTNLQKVTSEEYYGQRHQPIQALQNTENVSDGIHSVR